MCFTRRNWIGNIRKFLLLTTKKWRDINLAWRRMNSMFAVFFSCSVPVHSFGSALQPTTIFWPLRRQSDFEIHFESSVLKKEVCVNKLLRQSITTWNKKQGCKVELSWTKMLRGGGSCVSKILRWPRKNLLGIDFGKELPQPLHLMRQNCIKNTFFKKWGGF